MRFGMGIPHGLLERVRDHRVTRQLSLRRGARRRRGPPLRPGTGGTPPACAACAAATTAAANAARPIRREPRRGVNDDDAARVGERGIARTAMYHARSL